MGRIAAAHSNDMLGTAVRPTRPLAAGRTALAGNAKTSSELAQVALQASRAHPCHGCSTVVLIGFTCPAMTVVTVILRALDRVRERALGCFARSPKSPPAIPPPGLHLETDFPEGRRGDSAKAAFGSYLLQTTGGSVDRVDLGPNPDVGDHNATPTYDTANYAIGSVYRFIGLRLDNPPRDYRMLADVLPALMRSARPHLPARTRSARLPH